MSAVISFLSQKGGVGKSSSCRTIGIEFQKSKKKTRIADINTKNATNVDWNTRRIAREFKPEISVHPYTNINHAIQDSKEYNILLIDMPPESGPMSLNAAKRSDLIILPTGTSLDDLKPTRILASDLVKKKIEKHRIVFLLCRVGSGSYEIDEAKDYIRDRGFQVIKNVFYEKSSYQIAGNLGKSFTEIPFKKLRDNAKNITKEINKLLNNKLND